MIALFLLGLTVGGGAYVGAELIAEETKGQAFERQAEFAEQEAEKVQSLHERNELITETIATSELVVSETNADGDASERVREYLLSERDRHDGAENVHLIDVEEGEVVTSTSSELIGTTFDDVHTEWSTLETTDTETDDSRFVGVNEAQFLGEYTDPHDQFVVGYAAPVPERSEDGTTSEYVVVYSVGLEPFGEELVENDGQITYLINPNNNRILMDPTRESVWHTYRDGSNLIEDSNAYSIGRPGDSLANSIASANPDEGYEDDEYIASYAQLPGETNWFVVHHTREKEALGFVHALRRYGAYASVAGILGIVLLGGVIGRSTATSINRLRTKAEEMGKGNLDVEFETKRVDSIGQLYDEFATMRDSLKNQITAAEHAREEAERAREKTERVNRELRRKAEEYRDVMRACAEGDFTTRMDPETDNEAMREIATEFNEMIGEIEWTTEQLKAFANEVATASEQVTGSAESVRSASMQVTESIQEISTGAERQNDSLQAVTREMDELSTTTEQIAASSNEVADLAERTAQAGNRGREAARDAIEGMNEIASESDATVEEIERLQAEVEQIDELLEFITEVANQTNMLALNANIEASRSVESNEGFSAVAGEVKELAQETKDAAETIEDRLERITVQTERTAEEVEQTSEYVSEHTESVERAVDALDEIADYARETNDGVQEISAASEQQAASTQEVVAMVDDAATISEETTVEAESVAAAAEEQTSALVEVTQSANELSAHATHLFEALDRFDTEADVDAGALLTELSEPTSVADEPDGESADSGARSRTDEQTGVRDEDDGGDEVFSFGENDQ